MCSLTDLKEIKKLGYIVFSRNVYDNNDYKKEIIARSDKRTIKIPMYQTEFGCIDAVKNLLEWVLMYKLEDGRYNKPKDDKLPCVSQEDSDEVLVG